jgi:molecular chaperone DnaK (HSP70)
MAKVYELVPAKPYRKLKKDMAAIKEQARNEALVEELLRSNLKSQEQLADLIKNLKNSLEGFNKVIAEEKKIGVKNIKAKLQDVLNLNTELIQQVSSLTESLKKVLKSAKPSFKPKFPKPTLPVKQYKEVHNMPVTYRRTKEVGK